MPRVDPDASRSYDEDRFAASEVFRTDRAKLVYACFEPDQFIPVHAPDSDVIVDVRRGHGLVREGQTDHRVGPDDVVAVEAGTRRGILADEGERVEALLLTAPPPTDAEHDPVRRGLKHDEFEPSLSEEAGSPGEMEHGDEAEVATDG